jgi:hypothetical protein
MGTQRRIRHKVFEWLRRYAPNEIAGWVLDVAKSVGAAAKDTSASESAAIQKIDAALATP